MLQIRCPWCGPRDEDEFRYGGEVVAARPTLDADDARWNEYLFLRANTKGAHDEHWGHAYGCGRWFNVRRDTVTHDVLATWPLGAPCPALDSTQPLQADHSQIVP